MVYFTIRMYNILTLNLFSGLGGLGGDLLVILTMFYVNRLYVYHGIQVDFQ